MVEGQRRQFAEGPRHRVALRHGGRRFVLGYSRRRFALLRGGRRFVCLGSAGSQQQEAGGEGKKTARHGPTLRRRNRL